MKEEEKRIIAEKISKAQTKADLASTGQALLASVKQFAAGRILEIKDELNASMAFIRKAVADRHNEISEANRQQWKNDRVQMWDEAANTCTPQAIASILHAAKERGVLESYTVTIASGEVLKSINQ